MPLLRILGCILIAAFCSSFSPRHLVDDDKDVIYWSDTLQLQWSYFKGTPNTSNPIAAAALSSGFGYHADNVEGGANLTIRSYMNMDKSWVKIQKPYGLIHERGHFDLSELYARKMKAQLKGNYFVTKDGPVRKLFNKLFIELNKAQDKYDRETRHGIDSVSQEKWLGYIREELNNLDRYK